MMTSSRERVLQSLVVMRNSYATTHVRFKGLVFGLGLGLGLNLGLGFGWVCFRFVFGVASGSG